MDLLKSILSPRYFPGSFFVLFLVLIITSFIFWEIMGVLCSLCIGRLRRWEMVYPKWMRRRTALHEAAHGLVFVSLCGKGCEVWMCTHPYYPNHPTLGFCSAPEVRATLGDMLTFIMAGEVASKITDPLPLGGIKGFIQKWMNHTVEQALQGTWSARRILKNDPVNDDGIFDEIIEKTSGRNEEEEALDEQELREIRDCAISRAQEILKRHKGFLEEVVEGLLRDGYVKILAPGEEEK